MDRLREMQLYLCDRYHEGGMDPFEKFQKCKFYHFTIKQNDFKIDIPPAFTVDEEDSHL